MALDAHTGETRTKVSLKGAGHYPVAVLYDPPTDSLFVGTFLLFSALSFLSCFSRDFLDFLAFFSLSRFLSSFILPLLMLYSYIRRATMLQS